MPNAAVGGFQPISGFGYDRSYQDGIFIRSQFMDNLRIEERQNNLLLLEMFGERIGAGNARPGERFMVPTQSNPAVGDVTDSITTSGYGYPDYVATDSPSLTQANIFSRKIAAGTAVLGIPVPLQAPNEGQVELIVNQYRGLGMIFTRRFIEQAMGWIKNPTQAYSKKVDYALRNDIEEYCWLTWLYTGPITNTAGDYGTGANANTDAIGLTNRTNYAITRTLTSINGASNLITPTVDGNPAAGMSNTGNSRFGNANTVPFLFGSSSSDISYDTLARLAETLNRRNVPLEGRAILAEPKGYADIINLPQFNRTDLYGKDSGVYRNYKIEGDVCGFMLGMTNVIQPAGSSSNVLYEIAGTKGVLLYHIPREPQLVIDNRLNGIEQAQLVGAFTRYGAVIQRPDHAAVIQTRTRT